MANPNMSYEEALHAMQSGVAYDQSNGSCDGTPKHLRVGINSAMSDHCALVTLLIRKGVIVASEYLEELRVQMIEEVKLYEKNLSKKFNKEITLG